MAFSPVRIFFDVRGGSYFPGHPGGLDAFSPTVSAAAEWTIWAILDQPRTLSYVPSAEALYLGATRERRCSELVA
jgi:hypothetical protein